jgi:hypothetical protein
MSVRVSQASLPRYCYDAREARVVHAGGVTGAGSLIVYKP